jgi:hypothetical protein
VVLENYRSSGGSASLSKAYIKKQIERNGACQALQENALLSEKTAIILLVLSFLLNFLMVGSLDYLFMMVRSFQLILHLPMFNIMYPGTIMMMFQILLPFVMFEIIDLS